MLQRNRGHRDSEHSPPPQCTSTRYFASAWRTCEGWRPLRGRPREVDLVGLPRARSGRWCGACQMMPIRLPPGHGPSLPIFKNCVPLLSLSLVPASKPLILCLFLPSLLGAGMVYKRRLAADESTIRADMAQGSSNSETFTASSVVLWNWIDRCMSVAGSPLALFKTTRVHGPDRCERAKRGTRLGRCSTVAAREQAQGSVA